MSLSTQRKPYFTRPQFSTMSSNTTSDYSYNMTSTPTMTYYSSPHPLPPTNPHPQIIPQPPTQVVPPILGWIEFPVTMTSSPHPPPPVLNSRCPLLRMSAPHPQRPPPPPAPTLPPPPSHHRSSLRRERCPYVPLPKLPDASFSVGYYVPPSVVPGDPYGGMQKAWKMHFESLFQNLPHVWMFGPADANVAGWTFHRDMAKVRFACQHCTHGWTSMNGLVLFSYFFDGEQGCGHIRFSLKGQKCNQCTPTSFETPMWYPEEVQKVMTNLYYEVASTVYGFKTPPPIRNRRHGRPRANHNAKMCQGCHQGYCLRENESSTVH